MHQSAFKNCKKFVQKYVKKKSIVLDVGSFDINGSLKPLFEGHDYTGLDMEEGKNVDLVANSHKTFLPENHFDVIVSSSNFEHDNMFWLTFKEMVRIVKPGGLIYINAPSAGFYHGYPGDCWRFYKDCWKALQDYVKQDSKFEVEILEQYIDSDLPWKDNVGIFKKVK